jgi:hypothetical protein
MPETVLLAPVPIVTTFPGYLVSDQEPVDGNPLNITLPVADVHVGGDIVPITGAGGITGWDEIITLPDLGEVHPDELVTVNVYVPIFKFEIIALVPEPVVVTPPGERVSVQDPEEGSPESVTLPVNAIHPGRTILPVTGAVGTGGCGLIITFAEDKETHNDELVTVKV